MKPNKTKTRREQINELKIKWWNQYRSLMIRQMQKLGEIYQLEQTEKLEKKRKQIQKKNDNLSTHPSSTDTQMS
jgi:hypothetical protein